MSYQQTEKPKGFLYHYTTRDHLEDILREAQSRFQAKEISAGENGKA